MCKERAKKRITKKTVCVRVRQKYIHSPFPFSPRESNQDNNNKRATAVVGKGFRHKREPKTKKQTTSFSNNDHSLGSYFLRFTTTPMLSGPTRT